MQIFGEEYVEGNNSLQNLFEDLEVRVKENPLASVTIRFIGRVAGSPNQPTFASCAKMTTDGRSKRHMKDDGWTGAWAKSWTWRNS